MNQKELREIRRRFQPERSGITHIYGCYVNSNREIISEIDESLGLLSKEEGEKYLSLLKKALSGALGKNLLDISFATKQVMDSEEHRLLSALRKSELQDTELRQSFYRCIIDSLDMDESNYVILLAFDAYDVPHYGKDGNLEDSGEVYKYLLCSICPVKSGKLELGYVPEEKRFHSNLQGQIVAAPALGFLFPTFDERSTNLYNALLYTRSTEDDHQSFIDAVFRTQVPMPAKRQREAFGQVLETSLEQAGSFQVLQSVHEQLSERIALHRESKDPEPLLLSVDELGEILEKSGGDEKAVARFRKNCEEEFGPDAQLAPANLSDARRMSIESSEIKISLDPKLSYLIETREIDGRKYILLPADGGVELNGVPVSL
ncbi:MAG: DUF4317 domain-containing protein [Eubacteriales bacterium]|nr:DUF4317 domain-containing protein [Eubacteriales bacterium]